MHVDLGAHTHLVPSAHDVTFLGRFLVCLQAVGLLTDMMTSTGKADPLCWVGLSLLSG